MNLETRRTANLGKVYRIPSLKRMGNNAIMYWLLSQYKQQTVYLNEVAPFSKPFLAYGCKPLEENWNLEAFFYRNEDWPVSLLNSRFNDAIFDHSDITYESRTDILILRDPFNHLASRYKAGFFQTKSSLYNCADLWLILAREYAGHTNFCKNKIQINYNRWTTDIDYRKRLSAIFGTIFSDEKLNVVAKDGGGSSFNQFEYQGNAGKMETTNRWKHFINNKSYMSIFKNKEIYELSDKIFGNESILDTETNDLIIKNFSTKKQILTNFKISFLNLIFPFMCKLKYCLRLGSIGQLNEPKGNY